MISKKPISAQRMKQSTQLSRSIEQITPFTQRWQGPTKLLNNTLNSEVGGIYYGNYLLDLKMPTGSPMEEEVAIGQLAKEWLHQQLGHWLYLLVRR